MGTHTKTFLRSVTVAMTMTLWFGCSETDDSKVESLTSRAGLVGDGVLDGAETCDDGNTTDGDGCSSAGTIETGYNCSTKTLPSRCEPDVSAIYSNGNGGFWFSRVDNINGSGLSTYNACGKATACGTEWSNGGLAPDVAHDLLAFEWDGTTYSTGVDDASLEASGVSYVAAKWRGLPLGPIRLQSAGNVQFGNFEDGDVLNNFGLEGTPYEGKVFYEDASLMLSTGVRGLGMNTFINNVEYDNLYRLPVLDPTKIGDGEPDFLFINGASTPLTRGGAEITMRWLDASKNVVTEDQISLSGDATRPVQRPRTDATRMDRVEARTGGWVSAIRRPGALAFDAAYFGVTPANAAQIKFLEVRVNDPGNNGVDPDVFAYNETSTLPALFTCGDGDLDRGEECDDGNNVSNDGCQANCFVEDAYECFPSLADASIEDADGDLVPDAADADTTAGPDADADGVLDAFDVDHCVAPECTGQDLDGDSIDDGLDLDGLSDDDGDSIADGNDGVEDGWGPSLCLAPVASCSALGSVYSLGLGAAQAAAPPTLDAELDAGGSDLLVDVHGNGEVDAYLSATASTGVSGNRMQASSAAGQTITLELRPHGRGGVITTSGVRVLFDATGVGTNTVREVRLVDPFGVSMVLPFTAQNVFGGSAAVNGDGHWEVAGGQAWLDLTAYLVGRVEIDLGPDAPDVSLDSGRAMRACLAVCGNGSVEPGEGCDDGNTELGDGCDAACLVESGSACNGAAPGLLGAASCATNLCNTAAGVCAQTNACGNGLLEMGEGCDDGNLVANDGCNADCKVERDGGPCDRASDCATGSCNVSEARCLFVGVCGDGDLDQGESCDDGNTDDGDGCDATCMRELGASCASSSECATGICQDTTCIEAGPGNGLLESGEGCDDGNATDGDGCSAAGLVEDDAHCNFDAPGLTGSASCASGVCDVSGGALGLDPPTCRTSISAGNGILEAGEGCDDGNVADGDGCSATGFVEAEHPCNADAAGLTGSASCASGTLCNLAGGAPGVCTVADVCGNGAVELGEGCDDGNTSSGDGCDSSCRVETGAPCNASGFGDEYDASCISGICDLNELTPMCEAADTCGNGILEAGEICDDGNLEPNDGCDSACRLEDGAECDADGECQSNLCIVGVCTASNVCGNGVLEAGEGCDGGDDCDESCAIIDLRACNTDPAGATLGSSCASGVCDPNEPTPMCEPADTCGNGTIEAGEGCDDGNVYNQDGCDEFCRVETGTACALDAQCASGVCSAGTCVSMNVCGDATLEVGEGCDGGAGCTAGCLIETGSACNTSAPGALSGTGCASGVCDPNEATPTCEPAGVCGNGTVDAGEGCDDGNTSGGDGCDASCLVETGSTCARDDQCVSDLCNSVCIIPNVCGNGLVENDEVCDDGNLTTGDGCDATCSAEPGSVYDEEPPATPFLTALPRPDLGVVELTAVSNEPVDLDGYFFERAQIGRDDWMQLNGSPQAAVYTDSTASVDQGYVYRVRAIDTVGNESETSVSVVATLGQPTARTRAKVLAWEDMIGSGQNDLDYNDFILRVTATEEFADGGISRVIIDYDPLARGAGYHHEVRQALDITGDWTAELAVYSGGTSEIVIDTVIEGTGALDLQIFEDTHKALPPQVDSFTNTEKSQGGFVEGQRAQLVVTLANPGANPKLGEVDSAPWNLYLVLPYLVEPNVIRRPEFGGPNELTDNPDALEGAPLSFVIELADPPAWPVEGVPIWNAFDGFVEHVLSASRPDWADTPENGDASFKPGR